MDFFETALRVWVFVMALGILALTVFLIGIGGAGIANGTYLMGSFFFVGLILGLFGLGLMRYALTGDYAPPFGWWWQRDG